MHVCVWEVEGGGGSNQNNNDMKLKAKPILPILQQYSFDYKIHNIVVHVTNKYLEILVA